MRVAFGCVGCDYYYNDSIGLRALVSLKSGVQLEDSGDTVQDMNGNEVKLYNIK